MNVLERRIFPLQPRRRSRRSLSDDLLGAWSRRAGRWFSGSKTGTGWIKSGGRRAGRGLPVSWYWLLAGLAGIAGWKVIQTQRVHRHRESERAERLRAQFNGHGAHRELERLIRQVMHRPDSYAHIETKCRDEGDHLRVRSTFSGTNSQGEDVTNWVEAKIGLDGRIEEILDQGP